MLKTKTAHYIFHYNENSKAEHEIKEIAACQEAYYEHICDVLKVVPPFKLEYYLCNSQKKWEGLAMYFDQTWWGIEKYLQFYKCDEVKYGMIEELEKTFINDIATK